DLFRPRTSPGKSVGRPSGAGGILGTRAKRTALVTRSSRPTGRGESVDASNQELQQYLFDLQGYLVIHNVLRAAEVAELNRLIDAQQLPSPRESIRFGSAAGKHGPDYGFLNWGEPFCRLLHPDPLLPVLPLPLRPCFRLHP